MATRRLAIALSLGATPTCRRALTAALAALPPGARLARAGRYVTVVVIEEPGEARELAAAARHAAADSCGREVFAGVSREHSGRAATHRAMLEAEHALALGGTLAGDRRVTLFDELGAYCFVLGQPARDIRAFCERILGPLVREPERYDDLARTLEAYLRCHGSLNAVARTLFLHRNTVRQRLRRIAQLTGADLAAADDRLGLQLALLGRAALLRLERGRVA